MRAWFSLQLIGKFLTYVQFPCRYLMIATVFMCITAAIGIGYIARNIKRKHAVTALILTLCVLSLVPYFYD